MSDKSLLCSDIWQRASKNEIVQCFARHKVLGTLIYRSRSKTQYSKQEDDIAKSVLASESNIKTDHYVGDMRFMQRVYQSFGGLGSFKAASLTTKYEFLVVRNLLPCCHWTC